MEDKHYHEGELAMQTCANASDLANRAARAVADHIPERAIPFIEQQVMMIIGSLDTEGQVWASVLFGQPGFIRAVDVQRLELNLALAGTSAEDPLWLHLAANKNIGLLFIELASRRRLRVNGYINKLTTHCYQIEVKEAYPNCPKYIQRRSLKNSNDLKCRPNSPVKTGTRLNTYQVALIAKSDTFFVASAHPEYGIDASHRGGQPGFVQVLNSMLLRIPDYTGNNMFNTLGNFKSYPYAGLTFLDFEANCLLQLSGEAEILWPLDDPKQQTGGTQRFWQFRITAWRESRIPFDLDWEFLDYSSFNPQPIGTQV